MNENAIHEENQTHENIQDPNFPEKLLDTLTLKLYEQGTLGFDQQGACKLDYDDPNLGQVTLIDYLNMYHADTKMRLSQILDEHHKSKDYLLQKDVKPILSIGNYDVGYHIFRPVDLGDVFYTSMVHMPIAAGLPADIDKNKVVVVDRNGVFIENPHDVHALRALVENSSA